MASKSSQNVTGYVVFISLLFDLLAFTMILPLFPSLLDYYKQNDSGGLYQWLEKYISVFQKIIGVPDRFNGVLFGGKFYSFILDKYF